MSLQDCPNEIVHKILYFSVLARGVKRALRLKLVCKHFYDALHSALFESRLLDAIAAKLHFDIAEVFESYHPRQRGGKGADGLWYDYVFLRVNGDHDPAVSRFAQVRHVAADFSRRTGQDPEKTTAELCWFAQGFWFEEEDQSSQDAIARSGSTADLLSLATYFGDAPLAMELLDSVPEFMDQRDLFPSPMYMAAYTGNKELLLHLQQRMPEFAWLESANDTPWRGKISPGSIRGAVRRGEVEILQFALNPPSSTTSDFHNNHELSERVFYAIQECLPPTVEGLEYLKSITGGSHYSRLLSKYAALGHTDMVRHLLDQGVEIKGDMIPGSSPMREAIRHWQGDVVDLLVERGADVNRWFPIQDTKRPRCSNSSAIVAAAQSGSLSMMRKILDLGAVLNAPRRNTVFFSGPHALCIAVELEHTGMIELLLEKGAADLCWPFYRSSPWDKHMQKWPLKRASILGLDSMVEFLGQKGITMKSLDKKQWIIWHFD